MNGGFRGVVMNNRQLATSIIKSLDRRRYVMKNRRTMGYTHRHQIRTFIENLDDFYRSPPNVCFVQWAPMPYELSPPLADEFRLVDAHIVDKYEGDYRKVYGHVPDWSLYAVDEA